MDSDLFLVLGLIIAAFSIPSILGAYSEGRAPRVAMVMIVLAGGMVLFAIQSKPSGYSISQVPDAFVNVVARYVK